jgi:hypothetical protein
MSVLRSEVFQNYESIALNRNTARDRSPIAGGEAAPDGTTDTSAGGHSAASPYRCSLSPTERRARAEPLLFVAAEIRAARWACR